ncbi:hypothetical protein C6496_10710 [Candidatus Poribacteria bacterium]|nr:MAG: hypothetical protein C6496_10710 [Candidatus Poribacteria bacterium]
MAKSRVFYVFTMREKRKKKDLKKFLETEWIPVLRSAPGCLEVELLDSYQDRAGYSVSELWESREIHLQSTRKLWRETHTHLQQKVGDYATIEFITNCTILSA